MSGSPSAWLRPQYAHLPAARRQFLHSVEVGVWRVTLALITLLAVLGQFLEVYVAEPQEWLWRLVLLGGVSAITVLFVNRVVLTRSAQLVVTEGADCARREEAARLEGVRLAARTMQHNMGNHLAATVGNSELLLAAPDLPPHLRQYAERAVKSAHDAAAAARRLQRLTEVAEDPRFRGQSILDLARTGPEATP